MSSNKGSQAKDGPFHNTARKAIGKMVGTMYGYSEGDELIIDDKVFVYCEGMWDLVSRNDRDIFSLPLDSEEGRIAARKYADLTDDQELHDRLDKLDAEENA